MPNVKSSYLKVIKVPLGFKQEFKPISFKDKMPVLYMELLENKTKVKPELRNKDYVPPLQSTHYTNYQTALNNTSPPKNTYETNSSPPKNTYEKPISPKNTYEPKELKQSPKKEVKILDLKNNKIEIMSKHNKLKNLIDKKTQEVDNKKDDFDFIVDDDPKNDIYDTSSNTSYKNTFDTNNTFEEPKDEYKEEKSKEEQEDNKLSSFFDILKGKSILNHSPPQPSQSTQNTPQIQIPTQTHLILLKMLVKILNKYLLINSNQIFLLLFQKLLAARLIIITILIEKLILIRMMKMSIVKRRICYLNSDFLKSLTKK